MESLTIFILTVWGLSNMVAFMKIFAWLRKISPGFLREMLECPACNSFWIGLKLAFLGLNPLAGHVPYLLSLIFAGVLASGTSWIIFSIVDLTGVYDKH